jgi:uncharacterized RDD family membrane protein YckC
MTQQDETGHGAATDDSASSLPSPYLDASEGLPQAYLAPPQPDQPGYGAPPYRTRARAGGSGSQPYAREGYGQRRGYDTSGSGQPGSQTSAGAQSSRDPAIATLWARLAAGALDLFIIYGISVLAFESPLMRVWREFQALANTARRHNTPATLAVLNSLRTDPSVRTVLLYWGLALSGVALTYYWVQHAAWGATVGKRIVGVRVVQADGHARITVRTAGIRAIAFLAGPALVWILGASVVGSVLWAADNSMALLDPRAQCLHDKLAGTIVLRKRWLDEQARSLDP